jgi:hypothetical protein
MSSCFQAQTGLPKLILVCRFQSGQLNSSNLVANLFQDKRKIGPPDAIMELRGLRRAKDFLRWEVFDGWSKWGFTF